MRASTIVRSVNRALAYELVCVLRHEWRAMSHQGDVRRVAKKISGYVAVVIASSLAINVILSAPRRESGNRYPVHSVVNGLHIAVPDRLRSFPIEQLIALP